MAELKKKRPDNRTEMKAPKILVISHGHPRLAFGGGEVAAYSLFCAYSRHPDVKEAYFLASMHKHGGTGAISKYGHNEYLWEQTVGNDFYMEGANKFSTLTNFIGLIKAIDPDIVHLHHGIHLGYEIIELIRKLKKNIKIYFTLHEFIPICYNSGQMLKTNGMLCHQSGLEECHQCFPDKTPADFWQRKRRYQHYFSMVDAFITPSEFLRKRYIEWGLEPERIFTLENGMREFPQPRERALDNRGRNRFAFFGQINPYKGFDLLFRSFALLPSDTIKNMIFEVHGANLENQREDFRKEIESLRKKYEKAGLVRWIGSYEPEQISERMSGIDWVVVPSIWWENSPVTIQEAFACGRPVITANMGGMGEKVRDGIDGLLVQPRNPQSLADAFTLACGNNELWEKLHAGIKKPTSGAEAAQAHLELMGVTSD